MTLGSSMSKQQLKLEGIHDIVYSLYFYYEKKKK